MNPRYPLVLHVLLVLLCLFIVYVYVDINVFVEYLNADKSVKSEIRNPLSVIFIGTIDVREDGGWSEYSVRDRLYHLATLLLYLLPIVGTIRYFVSKRRKTGLLLFGLSVYLWVHLSYITYQLFYYMWNARYIEHPITSGTVPTKFIIEVVTQILVLFTIIYLLLKITRTAQPESIEPEKQQLLPLKWMRGVHYTFDRLILIAFGFNMFLYYYYASKYEGVRIFRDSYLAPYDALFNWVMLSLGGALLVNYLLLEGIFKFSPIKVLTGTAVVEDKAYQSTSWIQVAVRTLGRYIPLNALSFFSTQGWHDRISSTTLIYWSSEPWLARQSRFLRIGFITYLSIFAWLVIAIVGYFMADSFRGHFIAGAPAMLAIFCFPFIFILHTCWLAAVSNYAQNLKSGKATDSNSHFFATLLCWVPIFNYIVPGMIVYRAVNYFRECSTDTAAIEKLESRAKILCRSFGVAYTVLLLGIEEYLTTGNTNYGMFWVGLLGVAGVIWAISVINFAGSLQKIAPRLQATHVVEEGI